MRYVRYPRAFAMRSLLIVAALAPVRAGFTGRACAGEESTSELIDLIIAACRFREDSLLETGFIGGYEVRYGLKDDKSVCRLDYFGRKGKWRANLTYLESPDVPILEGQTNFEYSDDGREHFAYLRPTAQAAITTTEAGKQSSLHWPIWSPLEFWLTFSGQPLSEFFARSRDALTVLGPSAGAERVSVPFAEGGLIFYFARERRFAIRQVEHHFHEIGDSLGRQFLATNMKEIAPGVWAPSQWEIENYHGYETPGKSEKEGNPTRYALRSARIGAVDDRMLTIDYALGTLVNNNVTGKWWQEGAPPDSEEIDPNFWRQAMQQPQGVPKPRAPSEDHSAAYGFIAANVAAVALSLAIFLRWRRKRAARLANR